CSYDLTEETAVLEGQNAEEKGGGQESAGNEAPPKESGTPKESEGEGKKEEGEAPQPLTAEAIKLPEGLEVSDAMMEKFLGVMNDQTIDRKSTRLNSSHVKSSYAVF